MGQYDAVLISEFPNDEAGAKFALSLGALGNVTTETLKAFTETLYRKIVGGCLEASARIVRAAKNRSLSLIDRVLEGHPPPAMGGNRTRAVRKAGLRIGRRSGTRHMSRNGWIGRRDES